MSEDTLSYEEAVAQLEQVVARLEEGSHSLQETLDLYAAGQQLVTLCNGLLDDAELRLQELQITEDGEVVTTAHEE